MKKIFFLLAFPLLLAVNSNANPIIIFFPSYCVSEIYFDSNGKWFLEIHVQVQSQFSLDSNFVDSITLDCHGREVRIKDIPLDQYDFYYVITEDSLYDTLNISNIKDQVKTRYYGKGKDDNGHIYDVYAGYCYCYLSWGYLNGDISNIQPGQSACLMYVGELYKDNSPTIGFPNDTVDATGILRGKIYDMNNNLVPDGDFSLETLIDSLHLDGFGNYYTRVLAKYNKYQCLIYYSKNGSYQIDTISFHLEPHSSFSHNIHVLDMVYNINEISENNTSVIVLPNPFKNETEFYIDLKENSHIEKAILNVYNVNGALVKQHKLPVGKKISYNLRLEDNPPGMYYYDLVLDNNICKRGQMIMLK